MSHARRNARRSPFRFQGRTFPYFIHAYNDAGQNERTVEVPVVLAAVRETRGRVLEVGHVLGHYGVTGHTVVDLHETGAGVVNADVEDFAPGVRYDLIVSISTLEHVGFDQSPRDPAKFGRVLRRLREELLAPGGRLLVTLPLGYNPQVDAALREGGLEVEVCYLQRLNARNEWRELSPAGVGTARYGDPFPNANVLAVLSYTAPGAGAELGPGAAPALPEPASAGADEAPPEGPLWERAPAFGRRETLVRALRRLWEMRPGAAVLVETGTLRDDRPVGRSGDGWSTLAFAWYAHETGSRVHTVDLDPHALTLCRRVTVDYAACLEYICADSVQFLRDWSAGQRGPIHFLYLDSVDYVDREVSEAHHLAEVEAAFPSLAPACLVLFDDTQPRGGAAAPADWRGKGARAIPYLLEQGFRIEWASGGQVLLSRGGVAPRSDCASPARLPRTFSPGQAPLAEMPERRRDRIFAAPLVGIEADLQRVASQPAMHVYLETVRALAAPDGRVGELHAGSGLATCWLARQGLPADGFDPDPRLVERARRAARRLGAAAHFTPDDGAEDPGRFRVLHCCDWLDTLPLPWRRAVLARQLARAERVVFLARAPFGDEPPDEEGVILSALEDWQAILAPFPVLQLIYVGEPAKGPPTHILGVLDGTARHPDVTRWQELGTEPYPFGISAVVLARNEGARLANCLHPLLEWTDEILVCDMGSTDDTREQALAFTPHVFSHPVIPNFDRARNAAALRAKFRWVFFVDADEHVPPGFGPRFRTLLEQYGPTFEAVRFPFRHHFAGRHLTHLDPGYKAPSLYKNGWFHYRARPHAGARVEGRVVEYPPDAGRIDHHSYDSLAHYLTKMNAYTDTEAEGMFREGVEFHWRALAEAWARDFRSYYDGLSAAQDDVHGLLYSLMGGLYRMMQHAKLYEVRSRRGLLSPAETEVPGTAAEFLAHALAVVQEAPPRPAPELRVDAGAPDRADVVWFGPFQNFSGYGEESRQFLLALDEAGARCAGLPTDWRADPLDLSAEEVERFRALARRPAAPGFLQIVQDLPFRVTRHPEAGRVVVRTMFETDRLPSEWVQACNRLHRVWVPGEFSRISFAAAGVDPERLAVIPGCVDPLFLEDPPIGAEPDPAGGPEPTTFVAVFDWTRRKGWDILLPAFLDAFPGAEPAVLLLRVWSSLGYSPEEMRRQAAEWVRHTHNHSLEDDSRIHFLFDALPRTELRTLYRNAAAFVLPTRGEGWGRPFADAMACGTPVIGTDWGGNTAFMLPDNSYRIRSELAAVPESGWREAPFYQGHAWAEPDRAHLAELLRHVRDHRTETAAVGARGREHVRTHLSRPAVAAQLLTELEQLRGAPP